MSFSEQQIRAIVKDELRKIIDAGLMYTAECTQSINKPKEDISTYKPQEAGKQGTPSNQPSLTPVPSSPPLDVLSKFPAEIGTKLTTEKKGDYWIIKPKTFLQPEDFRIAIDTVQSLDGEYISAGKESHFRVPIRRA